MKKASLSRLPNTHVEPAPKGTRYVTCDGPKGRLSLLHCPASTRSRFVVLFVHGCFGSASDFGRWLPEFAGRGYDSYAVSLRGHGASHELSYWRHLFTPMDAFVEDTLAAIEFVSTSEGNGRRKVCLVGHAGGGGIAQVLACRIPERLVGCTLVSSVPGTGTSRVNWNWLKHDRTVYLRMVGSLGHPRATLPSVKVIRRLLFSPNVDRDEVEMYERTMAHYESIRWPFAMSSRFIKAEAIAVPVLVVGGEKDRLMDGHVVVGLADWLRKAGVRVKFYSVQGAGHLMMRDVSWKEGADYVLGWCDEL